ncbi:hypothetical protein Tco_0782374 [Tanacetum coccineum]
MFLFALNYLCIILKLSAAFLSTRIRFEQFPMHYAAGDKRYEFLEAENKRVQRELVVVTAKRSEFETFKMKIEYCSDGVSIENLKQAQDEERDKRAVVAERRIIAVKCSQSD